MRQMDFVDRPGRVMRRLTILFWGISLAILAFWIYMEAGARGAWDARVYLTTIHILRSGGNPYAAGMTAQKEFYEKNYTTQSLGFDHAPSLKWRSEVMDTPETTPPFCYVYSPITLPLLRFLGIFPDWLLAALYFSAVAIGFLITLRLGLEMATLEERPWLKLMLPFVVFFPALFEQDVILSCNIAYVLYGAVFAVTLVGWRKNNWLWFYIVVVAASTFKAPILSLLALPVLTGKRQLLFACAAGIAGIGLFALQPLLWPELFREYMMAVRLQFDWNGDFGLGPAGILSTMLWERGMPYNPTATIVSIIFAIFLGVVMLYQARRFHQGHFASQLWFPVVVLGVILLNPRVKGYDMSVLTIPMLLIAWRMLKYLEKRIIGSPMENSLKKNSIWRNLPDPVHFLVWGSLFALINIVANLESVWWDATAMGVMLCLFIMGIGTLYFPLHQYNQHHNS